MGDTNEDETMNFREFVRYLTEHEKKLWLVFQRLDTNQDGKSVSEYKDHPSIAYQTSRGYGESGKLPYNSGFHLAWGAESLSPPPWELGCPKPTLYVPPPPPKFLTFKFCPLE